MAKDPVKIGAPVTVDHDCYIANMGTMDNGDGHSLGFIAIYRHREGEPDEPVMCLAFDTEQADQYIDALSDAKAVMDGMNKNPRV